MQGKGERDSIKMDYFKKGAEVEISSEEEGFQGSWYAGTVVRRLRKDRVLVDYKELMEDEVGKRPLREVVDVVHLRPLPPREGRREFRFSEEVDAYYNEGWWEGVITEVMGDGRFKVFFRRSREQMKFRASELRLHREWVDDERWVPPLETEEDDIKEEPIGMETEAEAAEGVDMERSIPMQTEAAKEDNNQGVLTPEEVKPTEEAIQGGFRPGELVEVRSDEEGFEGALLSVTIIEQLNKDKYLVEYQTLRNDEDTAFLREEVDRPNIRPQPPDTSPVERFKVLEEVDALYNECWWVGIISKALEHGKYVVYFHGTHDEMEFKHCDLRQHQDWIDGNWVIPSQAMRP